MAGYPVASDILRAARPVGAARTTSSFSPLKKRMIVLIVVVLPVPGPPEIRRTALEAASRTAFLCRGSRVIFSSFSRAEILSSIFRRAALSFEDPRRRASRSSSIRAISCSLRYTPVR